MHPYWRLIALVHVVYAAMWYRFDGVFCSYICHLQHIVSQWWYREFTLYFVKCTPFTNTNELVSRFFSSCINWPLKFRINTTIRWPRVTQKYTMYVSLAFIDTFQSTLNTIIKTHFCWDEMVTISDGIFKYIFLNKNIFDISLKYVPCGLIENMSTLVVIMACCRTGD